MFEQLAHIVFFSSVAVLIYIYVGYPLLVYAVSRLRPRPIKKTAFEPTVTVLITAYNEEKAIRRKLENTLQIDYPREKLEILVASDCSTDRTDEIVEEFAARALNVKLYRQTTRLGKTSAQNAAVEKSSGEIILFSDATTDYEPDVLRLMLPNFADETVGCVAGRLIYTDASQSGVGTGARRYWGYETRLKQSESAACSLIGASGCLYAVRKSAYRPMYAEACSDFLICTLIYEQNLRSVFEPTAVCTEETNRHTGKEMRMRVRVIAQTYTDLWRNRRMLNPLRSGFFAVELVSHKLLRYAAPLFLILIFFASVSLARASNVFLAMLLAQIVFYALAIFGWLLEERGGKPSGALAVPLYFALTNAASVVAFYKFLTGERYATWQPIREGGAEDAENSAAAFNHANSG